MLQLATFLALAALVNSQAVLYDGSNNDLSIPTPYQFSYTAPAIGGGSSHEETGDEFGRKAGSYTVQNEDGSERVVQYVADEGGFRVSISTNEPGTANQNPADATIQSSAIDGVQAAAIAPPVPVPAGGVPVVRQPFIPRRFINQPYVIPFQPSVVPAINNRYFQTGGSRLIPFAGEQPLLLPLSPGYGGVPISDGYYQPNIFFQPL